MKPIRKYNFQLVIGAALAMCMYLAPSTGACIDISSDVSVSKLPRVSRSTARVPTESSARSTLQATGSSLLNGVGCLLRHCGRLAVAGLALSSGHRVCNDYLLYPLEPGSINPGHNLPNYKASLLMYTSDNDAWVARFPSDISLADLDDDPTWSLAMPCNISGDAVALEKWWLGRDLEVDGCLHFRHGSEHEAAVIRTHSPGRDTTNPSCVIDTVGVESGASLTGGAEQLLPSLTGIIAHTQVLVSASCQGQDYTFDEDDVSAAVSEVYTAISSLQDQAPVADRPVTVFRQPLIARLTLTSCPTIVNNTAWAKSWMTEAMLNIGCISSQNATLGTASQASICATYFAKGPNRASADVSTLGFYTRFPWAQDMSSVYGVSSPPYRFLTVKFNATGYTPTPLQRTNVLMHEIAHLYGARDEYKCGSPDGCGCNIAGWPSTNQIINGNAENCIIDAVGRSSQDPCLMDDQTASTNTVCRFTKGQFGWGKWQDISGSLSQYTAMGHAIAVATSASSAGQQVYLAFCGKQDLLWFTSGTLGSYGTSVKWDTPDIIVFSEYGPHYKCTGERFGLSVLQDDLYLAASVLPVQGAKTSSLPFAWHVDVVTKPINAAPYVTWDPVYTINPGNQNYTTKNPYATSLTRYGTGLFLAVRNAISGLVYIVPDVSENSPSPYLLPVLGQAPHRALPAFAASENDGEMYALVLPNTTDYGLMTFQSSDPTSNANWVTTMNGQPDHRDEPSTFKTKNPWINLVTGYNPYSSKRTFLYTIFTSYGNQMALASSIDRTPWLPLESQDIWVWSLDNSSFPFLGGALVSYSNDTDSREINNLVLATTQYGKNRSLLIRRSLGFF